MRVLRRITDHAADVYRDIYISFTRSPLRMTLLGLGTFIAAVMTIIATASTATLQTQVAQRLAELSPSRVQVDIQTYEIGLSSVPPERIAAVKDLPGVKAVAWYATTSNAAYTPKTPWLMPPNTQIPGFTVGGDMSVFEFKTRELKGAAVANAGTYIGSVADSEPLPSGTLVVAGNTTSVLAGTLTESPHFPDALGALITFAPFREQPVEGVSYLVQVEPGHAEQLAPAIQSAFDPVDPSRVRTLFPGDAANLQSDINTSFQSMALLIAVVLLIVSGLSVGIASFARVVETRRLLALLQAAGASRLSVVWGVGVEAIATGVMAAISGTALGLLGTLLVLSRSGPVSVNWWAPLAIAVLAVVINGVFSTVPAFFATKMPPARVLRE